MNKQLRSEQAHYLKEQILRVKASMGQGYFLLGELLKKIRDERLYKLLDYQTMKEFIAQPELAFSRTSVYDYIHMYETYILKLKWNDINPDLVANIAYSQLRKILPVVERSPEEWLYRAKTLSRGDLTLEVRESQGKPVAELQKIPDLRPPLKLNVSKSAEKIYLDIVKQTEECIICGTLEPIGHHFPRTHKRGGEAEDWKVIPICMVCHAGSHAKPSEWLRTHRMAIFGWFYSVISILAEKLKEEK